MSKFWSLVCYFLDIKRRLFITFHLQTDNQIEQQNSTIETYLQAFVNFEQNNQAWLPLIAKFTYNNAKNISNGHTPFELNCGYYLCVLFDKDTNLRYQSKSTDEISAKLEDLMTVCQKNLYHTQKLQKQACNKNVQPKSYILSDKIWLNSKYTQIKQNRKLEAKFFGLLLVPYLVRK